MKTTDRGYSTSLIIKIFLLLPSNIDLKYIKSIKCFCDYSCCLCTDGTDDNSMKISLTYFSGQWTFV